MSITLDCENKLKACQELVMLSPTMSILLMCVLFSFIIGIMVSKYWPEISFYYRMSNQSLKRGKIKGADEFYIKK
mgnify:CR=1 FL=1|jgi:hypothetical protein|tara:strand:+ start:1478 stop:1702 length:225 start_codon:yes stop_codon:yes gene_type:complete